MTEKEFLARAYDNDRLSLLAIAKEAGAKFDPEPVGLPPLGVRVSNHHDGRPMYYPVSSGGLLTQDEVVEVVRRCNAWDEMRRLAVDGQYYGIEKILGVKR